MTNTQHTPGPWSYHYERTINRHIVRSGFAGDRSICVTYGAGATSYECAANARLIAAAPLMLDALRSASLVLMGCVGTNDENELERAEAIAALRTAIASATGGAG